MIVSTASKIENALHEACAAADYSFAFPQPGKLRPNVAPVPLEKMLFGLGVASKEVAHLSRTTAAAALPALQIARPDMLTDHTALAGLLYVTPEGGCILVRANDPIARRRFSAAHELGHYLMHFRPQWLADDEITDDKPEAIAGDDTEGNAVAALDQREYEANRFAAELLMPEPIMRGLYDFYTARFGNTPRFIEGHLSSDLLVSRQAVRRRMSDLGLAREAAG
jgi:Zn-dependent peptidase ImmA (M78 family)